MQHLHCEPSEYSSLDDSPHCFTLVMLHKELGTLIADVFL